MEILMIYNNKKITIEEIKTIIDKNFIFFSIYYKDKKNFIIEVEEDDFNLVLIEYVIFDITKEEREEIKNYINNLKPNYEI